MRPTDHTTPFDHVLDDAPDLTTEFWGDGAAWQPRRQTGPQRLAGGDDTRAMRAIREGVAAFRPRRVELRDATGQVRRTRAHGVAQRDTTGSTAATTSSRSTDVRRAEATIGDLAAGRYDDSFDDSFDDPFDDPFDDSFDAPFVDDVFGDDRRDDHPRGAAYEHIPLAGARPTSGGVDPLLARLGVMLLVGVLLVPVALALRPHEPAPDSIRIEAPTVSADAAGAAPVAPIVAELPSTADPDLEANVEEDAVAAPAGETRSVPISSGTDTTPSDPATDQVVDASEGSSEGATADLDATTEAVEETTREAGITEAATVDETADRVVPACPQTYTAAPGDSWYRIADAAGVTPDALLVENRATVDTVILPGDDICLPSGATMPAPPTTSPATTTPATTTPGSTEPAPTTTAPPSTSPPGSPGRNASVAEVKDVIRSIFPESEWETAFVIASRESRFVPTAYNGWCCYGVFQIYWNVHKGWLDDLGINSSDDLFDPLLNVRAAHAIWQRSGNSWGAWSTYDG